MNEEMRNGENSLEQCMDLLFGTLERYIEFSKAHTIYNAATRAEGEIVLKYMANIPEVMCRLQEFPDTPDPTDRKNTVNQYFGVVYGISRFMSSVPNCGLIISDEYASGKGPKEGDKLNDEDDNDEETRAALTSHVENSLKILRKFREERRLFVEEIVKSQEPIKEEEPIKDAEEDVCSERLLIIKDIINRLAKIQAEGEEGDDEKGKKKKEANELLVKIFEDAVAEMLKTLQNYVAVAQEHSIYSPLQWKDLGDRIALTEMHDKTAGTRFIMEAFKSVDQSGVERADLYKFSALVDDLKKLVEREPFLGLIYFSDEDFRDLPSKDEELCGVFALREGERLNAITRGKAAIGQILELQAERKEREWGSLTKTTVTLFRETVRETLATLERYVEFSKRHTIYNAAAEDDAEAARIIEEMKALQETWKRAMVILREGYSTKSWKEIEEQFCIAINLKIRIATMRNCGLILDDEYAGGVGPKEGDDLEYGDMRDEEERLDALKFVEAQIKTLKTYKTDKKLALDAMLLEREKATKEEE